MRPTIPRLLPRAIRRPLALVLAAVLAACAGGAGRAAGRAPRGNPRVISDAEIRGTPMPSVLELVSTLRPQWLQPRGTDTLGQPGEIRVYVGNTRVSSGLSALRDMPLAGVTRIEFVDPITAAARWGLDHNQGAIVVTTGRR